MHIQKLFFVGAFSLLVGCEKFPELATGDASESNGAFPALLTAQEIESATGSSADQNPTSDLRAQRQELLTRARAISKPVLTNPERQILTKDMAN